MTSTITPRIPGSVTAVPIGGTGIGIIQCTGVGGTANSVTCNTQPTISTLTDNQYFSIRLTQANTGPVVLNPQGLGNKPWRRPNGTEFESGDLSPNVEYLIKYFSNEFRVVAPF